MGLDICDPVRVLKAGAGAKASACLFGISFHCPRQAAKKCNTSDVNSSSLPLPTKGIKGFCGVANAETPLTERGRVYREAMEFSVVGSRGVARSGV